jgi:uncharacterized membrane-anchored protein YhcB (DUF1043 family)
MKILPAPFILIAVIFLSACSSQKLEQENQALRESLDKAEERMDQLSLELAKTTAQYEKLCADIVESLNQAYVVLYESIDHNKERERSIRNYEAMKVLFRPLVQNLDSSADEGPAFQALRQTSVSKGLSGFSAIAFGVAAAEGHQPSLDVLLRHEESGILMSSAVMALEKPALNGNRQAQEFLLGVIEGGTNTALWRAAAKGLETAKESGDERARAAIEKYAKWDEERKSQRQTPVRD